MSGPHPQRPTSDSTPARHSGQPETAPPGTAASGFPEPPGADPGDLSREPTPYTGLNTPLGEPDDDDR
jgi:hypothetical protein